MITEIRADQLRFNQEEVATYLEQVHDLSPSEDMATILTQKSEGWITGIRLAYIWLTQRDSVDLALHQLNGKTPYLSDYLLGEILKNLALPLQHFALRLSLLDRFCAPLGDAVIADVEGFDTRKANEGLLDGLLSGNPFIIPLDEEGYWFRYHHLIGQLLQDQFRQRFGETEVANAYLRASN